MRSLRLIGEGIVVLATSGAAALLLYISGKELLRQPGVDNALFGGAVPITSHKAPWALAIVAVLLVLWLGMRALGAARGALWGACWALARTGFWWGLAALLLFLGVAAYGVATRDLSGLNWPFAMEYLGVVVVAVLVCGSARTLTDRRHLNTEAVHRDSTSGCPPRPGS